MELIKLPMSIGLKVVAELRKKGIEPRIEQEGPHKGMLSLEFTQEELDSIKELKIFNPTQDSLVGISKLRCLESLEIVTPHAEQGAYNKENASISTKDGFEISKIKSLKKLKLYNQRDLDALYLDELVNLESIEITRCNSLGILCGLENLKKVREFYEFGNEELFNLDGIATLINNNNLDGLELDVQHFSEALPAVDKIRDIVSCRFVDNVSNVSDVSYTFYQLLLFHQKCQAIAEKAKKVSNNSFDEIIYVHNYLAKNINYDYDALENRRTSRDEKGNNIGYKGGTNSAFNGIMYGKAVCEGYTKSMKYILKQLNIKTRAVRCISGSDAIKVDTGYHNQVSYPIDRFHSIIRVDLPTGIYYCDPCWDSVDHQRRNSDYNYRYCLLNKDQMMVDHSLSFEEQHVTSSIPYQRKNILDTLKYMKMKEQSLNNEMDDTVYTGTSR